MRWYVQIAPVRLKLAIAFAVQFVLVALAGTLGAGMGQGTYGILAGALAASAIAGFVCRAAIANPYVATVERMEALAADDFATPIRFTEYRDCVGRMTAAMEIFREHSLARRQAEAEAMAARAAAEEERQANDRQRAEAAANQVSTGSREINSAASDLARRIEQQAAQLEQSATTLAEVTGTVEQTSQNAKSAAELAAAARADATASSSVLQDTVNAMTGIEASARQIANIISVIDEIAFQTNLLALNAGVEAARAGEAGRGFTVVATEVRALAQRSADAAKEIKALISASGQQVGVGVQLVNETGQTLLRITGQINELAELVQGIAGAATQQASALKQVNASVSHMDRVTQENAAMVEETNAASQSLFNEAANLTKMLGEFKVGSAPAEPASAHGSARASVPAFA
jgi:methyl-accepting chemotaxis protein